MANKIEKNIYFDERCAKNPFSLNITRFGRQLSAKYSSLEAAKAAKEDFLDRFNVYDTEDPDIFIKNGRYTLIFSFEKVFDDFEEAAKKAEILRKFTS